MLSTNIVSTVDSERDPVVVLAADENFVLPLAAVVRSALDNLAVDRMLRIFVLDGGLSEAIKQRLEQSWPKGRFQITWIAVDSSTVSDLPIWEKQYNLTNYYRILMPRLLPKYITRTIYLVADMIVCTDLGRLWDQGFDGYKCLAVQDLASPFLDAQIALPNYDRCGRHLGSPRPVPNFQELGLNPRAPYFNSGLLVADVSAWRAADMPNQLLTCLRENRPYVRWVDQYAFNVVLSGRWGQLDLRWNQAARIFSFPSWSLSPFDRKTFEQVRDEPYIIHFTTDNKPWLVTCIHPLQKRFFEYVDRTAWAGWRPARFTHPRAFFGLLKAHRKRVKRARKRLQSRVIDWVQQHRRAAA
jgi:lipopolysaccharide biosynthesis glycosyltransferase